MLQLKEHTESTQRALREDSESTQRALGEHSDSTPKTLRVYPEGTQKTLSEHPESIQRGLRTEDSLLSSKADLNSLFETKNPHELEKQILQTWFAGLCNLCHPAHCAHCAHCAQVLERPFEIKLLAVGFGFLPPWVE